MMRTPVMAALAMLALVVQLLIPAAAMAQGQPSTMVLCTSKGVVTVAVDPETGHPDDKAFAGLACQDCLASSLTALAAEPPVLVRAPTAFRAVVLVASPWTAQARAQAPPRPPSQAPPALHA